MLTDDERAVVAIQAGELSQLVDDLAEVAKRRLTRVAEAVSERRS